jgi:membrane-associated phospholipid phosphatase
MKQHLTRFFLPILFLSSNQLSAQITDSTTLNQEIFTLKYPIEKPEISAHAIPFPAKSFIIPGIMVTFGAFTLGSHELQELNFEMKEEIWLENPHKYQHIDNYLQFAPAVAVYGLNAMGIKGKNNFVDRSMIYLMSNLILMGAVTPLKHLTHELRPDGSDYYSFPSGHTAEAFASAEFLRQEYKDVSPWYGVAGYLVASSTGILRMYNNRHWLGDIVEGAGIGIASTRLSYWLYPKIQHLLFKNHPAHTMIMPTYQQRSFGFSMVHSY